MSANPYPKEIEPQTTEAGRRVYKWREDKVCVYFYEAHNREPEEILRGDWRQIKQLYERVVSLTPEKYREQLKFDFQPDEDSGLSVWYERSPTDDEREYMRLVVARWDREKMDSLRRSIESSQKRLEEMTTNDRP